MICDDVISLISESPEAHGIFEAHKETKRDVLCQVRSLGAYDYWRAKDNGMNPEVTFRIQRIEYGGEKIVEWGSNRYRIIRASAISTNRGNQDITDGDSMDLVCEPATIDSTPTLTTTGVIL